MTLLQSRLCGLAILVKLNDTSVARDLQFLDTLNLVVTLLFLLVTIMSSQMVFENGVESMLSISTRS